MAKAKQLVRTALLVPVLSTFLLAACTQGDRSSYSIISAVIESPLGTPELQTIFQGLFDASKLVQTGSTPEIPVLIVPHHLTAAVTIAAGVSSLQRQKPTSILLLSPDHFDQCKTFLCASNLRFKTALGETEPDNDILDVLHASPLVSEQKELFQREHGILSVTPFITKLLPGTRVTPLVIRIRPDWKSHQEELLDVIRRATKHGTVLLVSSDFSHYLPLSEADAADEKTAQVLFSRDFRGIANLENPSQSDCPACLWIAAKIASESSAYNPSVLLHTNSARLLNDENVASTTSHFAIAFYKNAELSSQSTAFAGDVTITRTGSGRTPMLSKAIQDFWSGTGARFVNLEGPLGEDCVPDSNPYIFCNPMQIWMKIRNLATHWSIENNHKLDQAEEGYALTRAHIDDAKENVLSDNASIINGMRVFALTNIINPVAKASKAAIGLQYTKVIAALQTGSGSEVPQVVFVHAGTEFNALTTVSEKRYLRSFVDAGADAVIAVHSHIPSDMEMYRGAPIFHGLGNFLFDQHDAVATSTAKIVRLEQSGTGVVFETLTAR